MDDDWGDLDYGESDIAIAIFDESEDFDLSADDASSGSSSEDEDDCTDIDPFSGTTDTYGLASLFTEARRIGSDLREQFSAQFVSALSTGEWWEVMTTLDAAAGPMGDVVYVMTSCFCQYLHQLPEQALGQDAKPAALIAYANRLEQFVAVLRVVATELRDPTDANVVNAWLLSTPPSLTLGFMLCVIAEQVQPLETATAHLLGFKAKLRRIKQLVRDAYCEVSAMYTEFCVEQGAWTAHEDSPNTYRLSGVPCVANNYFSTAAGLEVSKGSSVKVTDAVNDAAKVYIAESCHTSHFRMFVAWAGVR